MWYEKTFLKITLVVVLVCVLFVGFLYVNHDIGVASSNLEADIRSSQKIKDDWTVEGSVSDTMAAYISYPQNRVTTLFLSMLIVPDSPLDISFVAAVAFQALTEELQSTQQRDIKNERLFL